MKGLEHTLTEHSSQLPSSATVLVESTCDQRLLLWLNPDDAQLFKISPWHPKLLCNHKFCRLKGSLCTGMEGGKGELRRALSLVHRFFSWSVRKLKGSQWVVRSKKENTLQEENDPTIMKPFTELHKG